MTKTERMAARLALVENHRRFAWDLAREEYARSAARMVAGKTHDLLNLVQVVQLAAPHLASAVDDDTRIFVEDIARVADDAHLQLKSLMSIARPPRRAALCGDAPLARGAPVGPAIGRVIGELADVVEVGVDYAIDVDAATALDEPAIAHLAIGMMLDVVDAPWIELEVRERAIEGAPWIELVRGTRAGNDGDHFDLRLVEALAARAGGEVTRSVRGDGGIELVVAMPALA